MLLSSDEHDDTITILQRHRASIVRLCASLISDHDAAEDIAQETLLVAWRNHHKVYAPEIEPYWLAGIARNLCRNWHRANRHHHRFTSVVSDDAPAALDIADDFDLERELERHELADLLDRALALLPEETRTVLVGRYVQEASHAELASWLGISGKAVSMRISRGKLLVKHLLHTQLRDEAVAFGLVAASTTDWQPTRIWCQKCAEHRLLIRIPTRPGTVSFRCPGCTPAPENALANFRLTNATFNDLFGDLQRPRSMLNRTRAWANTYFRQALRDDRCLAPTVDVRHGSFLSHTTMRHRSSTDRYSSWSAIGAARWFPRRCMAWRQRYRRCRRSGSSTSACVPRPITRLRPLEAMHS